MSPRSLGLSDALQAYVNEHTTPPDVVQQQLIDRTQALGETSTMQIAPEQGTFLTILVELLAPQFVVEVGTFTGYSSLAMARALPEGGRLLCCDISEEWTAIARTHWELARVDHLIDLRIGPAVDTLRALPSDPAIDLAFVDADKGGYIAYYEELLPRLSTRGCIAVDNTLWDGNVVDPGDTSIDTEAIRRFNAHVAADPRSEQVITPIGDGLTLIRRR